MAHDTDTEPTISGHYTEDGQFVSDDETANTNGADDPVLYDPDAVGDDDPVETWDQGWDGQGTDTDTPDGYYDENNRWVAYDENGDHQGYDDLDGPQVFTPPDEDPHRPAYRVDKRVATIPTEGWRRLVYDATGGQINPGISAAQAHRQERHVKIDTPVDVVRITVNCAQGGVGKSTTTVALGTVFAQKRRDQSVAIDANPDLGTLAERVGADKATTVRDLLEGVGGVRTANDLRKYLSQATSRLEVLAAEDDPARRRAFAPDEYNLVQQVLGTFRQCILTDTGTDLTHPVLDAIMEYTDSLVIAANLTATGTKKAIQTIQAWEQRSARGQDLIRQSVVAVRVPKERMSAQTQEERVAAYRNRVRAVVFIPNDSFLAREEDAVFEWERLARRTQDAYEELAAIVAEGFPQTHLLG